MLALQEVVRAAVECGGGPRKMWWLGGAAVARRLGLRSFGIFVQVVDRSRFTGDVRGTAQQPRWLG